MWCGRMREMELQHETLAKQRATMRQARDEELARCARVPALAPGARLLGRGEAVRYALA